MVLLGNHLIEMREHERRVVSELVTCISNQIVQWKYESGNSILTPAVCQLLWLMSLRVIVIIFP